MSFVLPRTTVAECALEQIERLGIEGHPDRGGDDAELERMEQTMAGKFEAYTGKNGEHFFRLKSGNGEVVLTSQGYKAKDDCANGIASVRKNSQRDGAFETKAATDGRQYFVLKATNGQVVGQSQMYKTASGCANGIDSVKRNAPDAPVTEA